MQELTFEDAIASIEQIVEELENGKLTLDESIKKFEKGMQLSKHCNAILEQAEKEITILIKNEDNEIVKEESFDTEE